MLISFSDKLEGARGFIEIGRVRAATGWHAAETDALREGEWKKAALQQLIRAAEDHDADAIVGVGYEVDGVTDSEATGLKLQRIAATGMAVKIRR